MPEFANRAEYEKWKADMIAQIQKEDERKESWICPQCLASVPGFQLLCACGYLVEPSLLKHFRGNVTSSELYKAVRTEFHLGNHETAVALSRYLVSRFPGSEETGHVREYEERHFEASLRPEEPGEVEPQAFSRKTERPARKMRPTRAFWVIAAVAYICVFAFFFASFLSRRPTMKHAESMNPPATSPVRTETGGSTYDMTAGSGMMEVKKMDSAGSPARNSGFAKGRELAKAVLTNKPSVMREQCYQAMLETRTEDEEYLRGCLEGYGSKGIISALSTETLGRFNERE